MFKIEAEESFTEKHVPFGAVEVIYPKRGEWDLERFNEHTAREVEALKESLARYDRGTVFGDNPYYRYFKKYKKTYPVLQQLESILLKGRPFPGGNPVNEVAFLTELQTRCLLGTHDIERIHGAARLFCPSEKLPFPGMRGDEIHTYPGDVSGRDDDGIIWSMIAGADERTYIRPESTHVAHLFFAVPGMAADELRAAADVLKSHAKILSPKAEFKEIWM